MEANSNQIQPHTVLSLKCNISLDYISFNRHQFNHANQRFHGGKTNFENIVASCSSCNMEKAHYMKMKPKNSPRKPTYYELVKKIQQKRITVPDEAWIEFIGWDQNLVTVKRHKHQH